MSNYSDQRSFGSSREYYTNDYGGTSNNNTTGNISSAYSTYTADNSSTRGTYGVAPVVDQQSAQQPQLDLAQITSLIAQSPQALSLLLALQQVQQLGTNPAQTVPSSAGYPSNTSGYNASYNNDAPSTRSHGTSSSEYYSGRGGERTSDRSDRRDRDDRSSSSGHGRRDREPSSNPDLEPSCEAEHDKCTPTVSPKYSYFAPIGRRGGPPEQRDGDWICGKKTCQNLNFSWRTECHLCREPRDRSAGQGSEARDHAEYSSQARSSEGRDYINYDRPAPRAPDTRPRGNDWHCPDIKCGHFNFSKRDRCQRCSAARPADHSTDVPRDFGAASSSGNYPSGGPGGYSDRRRERDRPY